jgi:hypothetical protein
MLRELQALIGNQSNQAQSFFRLYAQSARVSSRGAQMCWSDTKQPRPARDQRHLSELPTVELTEEFQDAECRIEIEMLPSLSWLDNCSKLFRDVFQNLS